MAWSGSAHAKIIHGCDQPPAEEVLPPAVDRNPAGERIGGIEEPVGKVQAIGAAVLRPERMQGRRRARLDLRSPAKKISPDEQMGLPRTASLNQDPGLGF